MKLINLLVVLVILCGVNQMSHGVNLNCLFNVWDVYTCEVTSLDNSNNSMVITGYSGQHKDNKNDKDVQSIWIHDTNATFIPRNLGLLFNLSNEESQYNLPKLLIWNTKLIEIKSQDFDGMQSIKKLTLSNNSLTSVPVDAFSTLTKLKQIDLGSNPLEEIPNGLFANNQRLEIVWLSNNKIQFLDSTFFDGLKQLTFVGLDDNICINKQYKGNTGITELKNDIQLNCTKPNELQSTTTTE